MYKSQDVVIKFVDYVRVNGDALQYADALWIQLPESPLYPILEGRFPAPAKTYESIAHILEDYEKKRINNLIGERRTRIGARLGEVTLEVKREVYAQSKLEHIYRQLINWTSDDDLRRTYEEKLLQYCYDRLLSTAPGSLKEEEQKKVHGLARDMVVIKHPYKLAWDITIDWEDAKEIKDMNVEILRNYCGFFPESDQYKVITGYLTSKLSPFPQVEQPEKSDMVADESEDSDDDDGGVPTSVIPLTDEDRLIMVTDGIATADSLLAYRLAGQFLVNAGDYESSVEYMRKALVHLKSEKTKVGILFENSQDDYNLSLGTALVYFQSPRHHHEAKSLFDAVLEHDPTSTPAFIGVGLIFEEEEEYGQAIDFFDRALKRDGTNIRVRSEAAWVRALNGDYGSAKEELINCIDLLEKEKPQRKELLADCQYRLGYCIWNLDTSKQARKQKKGECAYTYWLSALKNNPEHAPTYTSLGIYYHDYARDRKRSRRCFQKALEVSPSEVISAERLARIFADEGDWDRVELVAQRIVDSGKVKPPPGSKRKGISWPFAALGVAELNKQDYHKSIVSFQAALRISPEDYHCWVGLGESYHSSGRYIAATKAILNAQQLEEKLDEKEIKDDTWFTKYMLANIKRELGEFDEAISLYQAVMETHAQEEGVILALMQTMTENAWNGIEKGQFGKSVHLAIDVLEFAATVSGNVLETFNFWKSVGDACSIFSSVQSRTTDFPTAAVQKILGNSSEEAFELLAKIDKVSTDVIFAKGIYATDEQAGVDLVRCLHANILCHKQAIFVSAGERHAQAVAHYNLGWAEYRAHTCLPHELRKQSSSYLKGAVRSFKRAIELEAGNAEFWNALGVATSEINGSVSQHAFVRSLHLNERSPVAWTNLGVLAILAGDMRVANEVFTRAQSTDPDYTSAWVGQGFYALLHGHEDEARGLLTHAMEIAESSAIAARRHYASATFDHFQNIPSRTDYKSCLQSLYALNQVQSLRPEDLASTHLAALYAERIGEKVRPVEILEKLCETLETDYERTESRSTLGKSTLTRTDLARAYLAAGSYEKAIECGGMALELSSDESDSELHREQRQKARLSAHLTVGLAHYFAKNFDEAVKYFETALEEAENNPDAVCLLAQVLWAQGSESSKETARSSLFEVIEKHPSHVRSVLLLGAIALLDNDEDSLEAVVEELLGLRTNNSVTSSEQADISNLLRAIARSGEDPKKNEQVQAQNDVMMYPHLPHGWSSLAEVAGDSSAAQMALVVANRGIPPRGVLEAEELARASAGSGTVRDAQRAAFIAPWEEKGWKALDRVQAILAE